MIINLRQICAFLLIAFFLCTCSSEKNSSAHSNSTNMGEEANLNTDQRTLNLCVLGNNASEFDGKIVRLKTRLSFGMENTTFSDAKCSHAAVVEFKNKTYVPLDKLREESSRHGKTLFYADVEVEGKFINKPFTDCCTIAPFQFEITKIYEAQPVYQ